MDSHRLINWAGRVGGGGGGGAAKQNELVEELFKAYFTQVGMYSMDKVHACGGGAVQGLLHAGESSTDNVQACGGWERR